MYKAIVTSGIVLLGAVPMVFIQFSSLLGTLYNYAGRMVLNRTVQKTFLYDIWQARPFQLVLIIFLVCSCVFMLVLLFLKSDVLKKARSRELKGELLSGLGLTFAESDTSLIYIKDEKFRYIFVNRAFLKFFSLTTEQVIGREDYELREYKFAEKIRESDQAALQVGRLVSDEIEWENIIYQAIKFPVRLSNGNIGVGAIVKDITEERKSLKRQIMISDRNKILAEIMSRNFSTRQEQLDFVLEETLHITKSALGFIFLYDEQLDEFTLNASSKNVMEECEILDPDRKIKLHGAGIWGEAVRQRKPIVINNFEQDNHLKKGYPKGHVKLKNFMAIPVIVDGKIVAVAGLANKKGNYTDDDVCELSALMGGVWNAVERREALQKLSYERNKYLGTLISIDDGVVVVSVAGVVEMLNGVAENLTGWSNSEAEGKQYKEVVPLSFESGEPKTADPIEQVMQTGESQKLEGQSVLTSKSGSKYYLESSASPIRDNNGVMVGVVLVFRDITDKREQLKQMEYLSLHDSLTGLYNRRYFEDALKQIDKEDNLPITIMMADVNGLKLTNDIFGHLQGDLLLKRVAEVFTKLCRKDDVIARWGGDEFAILFPKTTIEQVEILINQIEDEFAKSEIKAVKSSVSMGCDTKSERTQNVIQCIENAEDKMYAAKTVHRDSIRSAAINDVLKALHEHSVREKDHSERVSEWCQALGEKLHLSPDELHKLKEAAYLHDIGKIVLEPGLLDRNRSLTKQEWDEVKRHSIVGYRILNSFDNTLDLAESVLAHHERWDGTGYPKGLKGDEIPKLARMIALVEGYDRMVHDTGNLAAMTKEQAIESLRVNKGKKFDPDLVDEFTQLLQDEQ